MSKKTLAVVVLLTGLSWAVAAQDAQTVIGNASTAMGGDTLKTIQYSGSGFDFALGQAAKTVIVNANTPWVQQLEIWMTPHGFLRAAAANNATVKTQTVGGKRYTVLTFTGQNKAMVNGYLNDRNLVERVETWIDNAMLGDMLFEVVYSDYKDYGGVKFPTKILQRQGGHPILDLTINDVKPNAPADIQAPQGGGGAGQAAAGRPPPYLPRSWRMASI